MHTQDISKIVENIHHGASYLNPFLQVGLLLSAAIGATIAVRQLNQQLRLSRASFLMEIDLRWDSDELRRARKLLHALTDEINIDTTRKHSTATAEQRDKAVKRAWAERLRRKREENLDDYMALMAICGFFETVGLMVERKYIELDEIESLLKGPILAVERCFAEHIQDRNAEMGVPKGLYENALNLSARLKTAQN